MAVNDPNYRYAEATFEGDGATLQFTFAFDGGYIRQSDVVGYTVVIDPGTGLPDGTTRTPVALTFVSEGPTNSTVSVATPIPVGTRLVIYRSTEKSKPLVAYANNSRLTNANLDLANKQAIFGIAEIMDGLNDSSLKLGQAVNEIIDTKTLVDYVYNQVIELLNASGIIGVKPLVWSFVGNGSDTDFPIAGADLNDASFYDAYVSRLGQEPVVDFVILPSDAGGNPYAIRFAAPPANGAVGFVILRGSAKPYAGGAPVTEQDLRSKMIGVSSTAYFVDKAAEFGVLRCTSSSDTLVTINAVAAGADPKVSMQTGSYFSATQRGSGQVTLAVDPGANLIVPAGCLPKTRGVNSTISAVCEDIDTNSWIVSGDLMKAP